MLKIVQTNRRKISPLPALAVGARVDRVVEEKRSVDKAHCVLVWELKPPMTSPTIPLENLAQRIAQQQAELDILHQEFEARQSRLADLKHRKEELQTRLQQIIAEIQAVDGGAATVSAEAAPATPVTPEPSASTSGPLSLSNLVVGLVRGSQGPVTVKRLAEEVRARKLPDHEPEPLQGCQINRR